MRILVVPELLRAQAAQLRQAVLVLEACYQQVQRAWASLDWEVRAAGQIEESLTWAQRQAIALGEEAERLARFLQARADDFEQADATGSAQLAQVVAALRAPATTRLSQHAPPLARLARLMRMGALLANASAPPPAQPARLMSDLRAPVEFSAPESSLPTWRDRARAALAAWQTETAAT